MAAVMVPIDLPEGASIAYVVARYERGPSAGTIEQLQVVAPVLPLDATAWQSLPGEPNRKPSLEHRVARLERLIEERGRP